LSSPDCARALTNGNEDSRNRKINVEYFVGIGPRLRASAQALIFQVSNPLTRSAKSAAIACGSGGGE